MSCPCTASVTGDSTVVAGIDTGTMLTVSALHKNTKGEYWYKVLYYGKTCYVKGSAATLIDHLTGDVTATDLMSPATLGVGDTFPVRGTVSATVNQLGKVTASMYSGSNITRAPSITASDTAANNKYILDGSKIDYNLAFNTLTEDEYTYVLTAEATSYYIDDNDALATSTQTVVLQQKPCIINDVASASNATAFGIDVSYAQGTIDWSSVSKEIDFCIFRTGYENIVDDQFYNNANGCTAYGVPSANLDVTYTVQVGGLTVSYSGLSYVYQVKSYSGSAVSLQNLAAALYAYNREANSYFG